MQAEKGWKAAGDYGRKAIHAREAREKGTDCTGFDVGTQSTRALLINNRGSILAKAQKKHEPPYVSPDTDYAEQDAQFYYGKLCEAA